MKIIRSLAELNQFRHSYRNKTIGFVPTMGALHAGHGSLMDQAQQDCDITIVSIFVNLKQFSVGEDFDCYPKPLEKDIAFLEDKKVDAVFLPEDQTIYPPHFSTVIRLKGVAEGLESLTRPHFFEGVATVVTKLFMLVKPHKAYFGLKDYQQFSVIKQLVSDLSLPIDVVGVPTVREKDGLAFSSRNAYLTEAERPQALFLYKALCFIRDSYKEKITTLSSLYEEGRKTLIKNGFSSVDYLEIRDSVTLSKDISQSKELRILGAATVGKTRLIDNIPLL